MQTIRRMLADALPVLSHELVGVVASFVVYGTATTACTPKFLFDLDHKSAVDFDARRHAGSAATALVLRLTLAVE